MSDRPGDGNAPYNVYLTLENAGVGIWDGRWKKFYDRDTLSKLERFLAGSMTRQLNTLKEAIIDAAFRTSGA